MSGTLLRFGLWIVLIVLALYVLRETYSESPAQEYLSPGLLQKAGAFGLALIAAGAIASMFEKTASVVLKKRCQVCHRSVSPGELFCRQHLRSILEEEHD